MLVEFLKNRAEFKKGDIVEMTQYNYNLLVQSDLTSCKKSAAKDATMDAGVMSKRQAENKAKEVEVLKAKAKALEESRN